MNIIKTSDNLLAPSLDVNSKQIRRIRIGWELSKEGLFALHCIINIKRGLFFFLLNSLNKVDLHVTSQTLKRGRKGLATESRSHD